ncbi:hypothetical protein SM124_16555 [Bacillus sp. 31A1R]|uniref:DUF5667 domain-containing protein n=1 Tax=Robertmurraya mangrovi TaxID=3098077 RepID=A0ABU5J1Q5_9BACI|nr:hypothetical protein [Bacillus sp. 31A1R]MDZ5473331.1 hypothetical protein [Bacillus sp. 31A1R]
MRLSRVNKYRKKRRKKNYSIISKIKRQSKNPMKKLIISSTLIGTALCSTSVAYAQIGISDHIRNWYIERLSEVEEFLTTSIKTDATNQKANLLRQVREQTELSVKELQEYAADKRASISTNIERKAQETATIIDSQNQEDMQKAKENIDEQVNKEMEDAAKDQAENQKENPPEEDKKQEEQESGKETEQSEPTGDSKVETEPSESTKDSKKEESPKEDTTEENSSDNNE